jgi:dTMP kinase
MFIVLDGIDGAGKSTQIDMLRRWLEQQGFRVTSLRDPGSTALGEAVREILLHREEIPISPSAEMLLYMAARAQLVNEQIRPALAADRIVISDRYLLANVVYQGCEGGVDLEHLWTVGEIATQGIQPDITILLDLPVATAMARIGANPDRLEKRGEAFYQRVRNGFLSQLNRSSPKTVVINAEKTLQEIHLQISKVVSECLGSIQI